MTYLSGKPQPKDPNSTRTQLVGLLNQLLADTVDLRLQTRQASIAVGTHPFPELKLLLDGLSRDLRECIDAIAWRIVSVGGYPKVTVQVVAHESHLRDYPLDVFSVHEHLRALLSSYSRYELDLHNIMNAVKHFRDAASERLLEVMRRSTETDLWFLEVHPESLAVCLRDKLPAWSPAFENPFRKTEEVS
jgi:starvation-inducible DNA-binding protein